MLHSSRKKTVPFSLSGRHLVAVLLWGVAALGILSLQALPGRLGGHSLCGPWGCVPPLQELAALHGFWIVVIVPAAWWAIRRWSSLGLRQLGLTLMGLGVVGLGIAVVWEWLTWLPTVPTEQGRYIVQRILFAVASWYEAPLVQMTLAGVVCWIAGKRRRQILLPSRSYGYGIRTGRAKRTGGVR